jgi:hypothetical protein
VQFASGPNSLRLKKGSLAERILPPPGNADAGIADRFKQSAVELVGVGLRDPGGVDARRGEEGLT